jgi:hypothetical protein
VFPSLQAIMTSFPIISLRVAKWAHEIEFLSCVNRYLDRTPIQAVLFIPPGYPVNLKPPCVHVVKCLLSDMRSLLVFPLILAVSEHTFRMRMKPSPVSHGPSFPAFVATASQIGISVSSTVSWVIGIVSHFHCRLRPRLWRPLRMHLCPRPTIGVNLGNPTAVTTTSLVVSTGTVPKVGAFRHWLDHQSISQSASPP